MPVRKVGGWTGGTCCPAGAQTSTASQHASRLTALFMKILGGAGRGDS